MLKLILAGILAIPCILVAVATATILAILSIPSLLLLLYRKDENGTKVSSTTTTTTNVAPCDHVIIFGGSSGIGLAIAKECARKKNSMKITILARNKNKLDDAKNDINKEVSSTGTTTKVEAISVSVSDYDALEKIAGQIAKKEEIKIFV